MINLDIQRRSIQFQKTFIFLIGFTFWESSFLMQRLAISDSFNSRSLFYIRIFGLVVILLSEILSRNSSMYGYRFALKKILPFLLIAIFLIFNNYYLAGKSWFIDILLIVFCARDINYRQFLSYSLGMFTIYYLGVILANGLGIIPSSITYRELGVRNSLGFGWSTWPAFGFFYISLIYMVLRGKRVTYFELLIITTVAYFFYHMTTTRYAFLLTLLLVLVWLFKKISNFKFYKNSFTHTVIYLLYPALTFFIYYLSKNATRFSSINKLFSGRLTLGQTALQNYGVKILGRQTNFSSSRDIIGVQYSYVDSAMLQSLIIYGVIAVLLIGLVFYLFERRIIDSQNDYLLIAIAFTMGNGFTDPQLLEPFYNIFFVMMGCLLINNEDAITALKFER